MILARTLEIVSHFPTHSYVRVLPDGTDDSVKYVSTFTIFLLLSLQMIIIFVKLWNNNTTYCHSSLIQGTYFYSGESYQTLICKVNHFKLLIFKRAEKKRKPHQYFVIGHRL